MKWSFFRNILYLFSNIKVLLHSRGEVALMKDMAFAAAPGSHTLVAIKQRQVRTTR